MEKSQMKSVYTIVERNQTKSWIKIGIGFVNTDGSLNLKLDATPTNGTLHVRDYESPEERQAMFARGAQRGGGGGGMTRTPMNVGAAE